MSVRLPSLLPRALFALAACLTLLLTTAQRASAELAVPPLKSLVTDTAAVLSPAFAQRLDASLVEYQRSTGHQLAFVSVSTLEGEPIEAFALRVAEAWKLGDKTRDDGLILLVAKEDRKMRIEVGYGLEGAIPDALAAQIIRNQLTVAFKKGEFDSGIAQAFSLLMKAAEGEAVQVEPPPSHGKGKNGGSGLLRLLPLFVLFMLIFGGGRRGGGGLGGIAALGMMSAMGGRRHGGGGFGGGFGGGGFGGGGGGGFGGGGASGGW